MNAPPKISIVDICRERRATLLADFCALEMALAKVIGPGAHRMFSQKFDQLSKAQLAGVDAKWLIAARNLVAHAHIVAASCSGAPVSVWRVPHHDAHLNALVMDLDDLEIWFKAVQGGIKKLRSQLEA